MADTKNDNLALWSRLGKTDPAHTKAFTRGGGFKGTAIKPIYTTQKMTEEFGPAGQGWGMGEPSFQTVPGSDGQVAVYCTVSLWYAGHGGTVCTVYGVGGDMVVVKQSSGLRTDDEAFKKAFTDALGNAMKHLGMSADVHMGLFDDSKYVRDVAAELAADHASPRRVHPDEPDEMPNTAAKMHWKAIYDEMAACTTLKQLRGAWDRHYRVFEQLPQRLRDELLIQKDEMKDRLMQIEEDKAKNTGPANYVPPNFEGAPQ